MPRKSILRLLEGGDRRTIGHSDRVVAILSDHPKLFPKLIAGLWSADYLVRMRAADATEKVTRQNYGLLQPYKKELLGLMTESQNQELRWQLAVIVPRLLLTDRERALAVSSLISWLEDRSSIVKTYALQGLADLAQHEPGIRGRVVEILSEATRNGTAAMKARGRKLLIQLDLMAAFCGKSRSRDAKESARS